MPTNRVHARSFVEGRAVAWIEGGVLCAVVLLVVAAGGETVRASYHGYAQATIGEAVLRDGLLPENPYHAGARLRYYTLYPVLGVLLGRLGPGPLWGFALLNAAAALLFGPALDALGRSLRLGGLARRGAFVAALLTFNGLGWLGPALLGPPDWGRVPLEVLGRMTFGLWDPRLEAFGSKWLNATSFAAALPFTLWSLAAGARVPGAPRRLVAPLAAALALNPLAGGFAALCIASWKAPGVMRDRGAARLAWPAALAAAGLASLPFLLPVLTPAPGGPDLLRIELRGHLLWNLAGPLLVPLGLGVAGLRHWDARGRRAWSWAAALALLALLAAHERLPFGNEYKFVRLAGLLWALPAGCWAAALLRGSGLRRLLPVAMALLLLPGWAVVIAGYVSWGRAAPLPPLTAGDGGLVLREGLRDRVLPDPIREAVATAPENAVVLVHPGHPETRSGAGTIQGTALAPLLRRPLVVDLPQIHNVGQPDLELRLTASEAFWRGGETRERERALEVLRETVPGRQLLVLSHDRLQGPQESLAAHGRATNRAFGYNLWLLPALRETNPDEHATTDED